MRLVFRVRVVLGDGYNYYSDAIFILRQLQEKHIESLGSNR